MSISKSLHARILKHYSKNANTKKKLFSASDLLKIFDIDMKAATNVLYTLHRSSDICRHKDKVGTGGAGGAGVYQYAVEIADKFNSPYESSHSKRTSPTSSPSGLTAIQKMFQAIQNNMARLEDMIMQELAEGEKVKKQAQKLRTAMRAIERLDQEN